MIAFAAGFLLDLLIGDPHILPHPVRWIGSLIAALDKRLLGTFSSEKSDTRIRDKRSERAKGLALVIVVIAAAMAVAAAVMLAAYRK